MHKIVKYAMATNLIVGLVFIYSNLTLWNLVNAESPYLIASHWSPLGIVATHYIINDGTFSMVQTLFLYFNTPFWIFWMLMVVNLIFLLMLSREIVKQRLTNEMPKN